MHARKRYLQRGRADPGRYCRSANPCGHYRQVMVAADGCCERNVHMEKRSHDDKPQPMLSCIYMHWGVFRVQHSRINLLAATFIQLEAKIRMEMSRYPSAPEHRGKPSRASTGAGGTPEGGRHARQGTYVCAFARGRDHE